MIITTDDWDRDEGLGLTKQKHRAKGGAPLLSHSDAGDNATGMYMTSSFLAAADADASQPQPQPQQKPVSRGRLDQRHSAEVNAPAHAYSSTASESSVGSGVHNNPFFERNATLRRPPRGAGDADEQPVPEGGNLVRR